MRALFFLLIAAVAALHGGKAEAHALQPGYLELSVAAGDSWRVYWRKPDVGGRPMPIEAELPAHCTPRAPPEAPFDGAA